MEFELAIEKERDFGMKTVVIGLDGASWDHLDPWLTEGELPNLKELKETGAWSYSTSELPYVTFPNWKCYSTGKNPGKLGVYWWELVDMANRSVTMPDSRSFHGPEVFDYLGSAGTRCAVLNMPTTYPPRPLVQGFMVAGGPGCASEGYTTPSELEEQLRSRFNYRPHPTTAIDRRDEYVREVLDLIDLRFEVGKHLLDRVDFLQITVFYINMLQHFFWRDPPVLEGWRRIDRHLGDLMASDCRLALVSDHGCCRIERIFNINAWLAREGYLVLRKYTTSKRVPVGVKRTISRLRRDPTFRELAHRWIPPGLLNRIGLLQEELRGSLKFQMIDWERTVAFASGQGPVYLNRESLCWRAGCEERICRGLAELRDPHTGSTPVRRVFKKEELYHGPYVAQGPDLVAEQAPGYFFNGRVGRSNLFEAPERWKAENSRQGIFLLRGKGVAPGARGMMKITDIAPTLLHWHGLPIPGDMDGEVLHEFFERHRMVHRESPTDPVISAETPAVQVSAEEDEEAVRRQLVALGYME